MQRKEGWKIKKKLNEHNLLKLWHNYKKVELKSLWMNVKEEIDWKSWLETKVMASSPITSWQIEGGKMETVTDFIFLGSKITVDSDCSHEIKTLAPGKKSYDKPRQYIKKQRHHFANKGPYSQSYGFSSHVWTERMDVRVGP